MQSLKQYLKPFRVSYIIENVDIRLLSMKYLISMILVTWLLNPMCPEN